MKMFSLFCCMLLSMAVFAGQTIDRATAIQLSKAKDAADLCITSAYELKRRGAITKAVADSAIKSASFLIEQANLAEDWASKDNLAKGLEIAASPAFASAVQAVSDFNTAHPWE